MSPPHTLVVRYIRLFSPALLILIWLVSTPASHALDCGNGKTDCSIGQLASFLERIKDSFETEDYIYDQIYAEGESTLVFQQRILIVMDKLEREHVKEHGANKAAALPELCATKGLQHILNQGVNLKYEISDMDRNLINTFTVTAADC